MRFSELKKSLTGVTQKMLTQKLRDMENDKIITRKVYPVVPPKVEYSLIEFGKTLKPVLDSLWNWGEEFKRNNTKIKQYRYFDTVVNDWLRRMDLNTSTFRLWA